MKTGEQHVTCRELIEFLSDYVEKQLPAETVAVFDHHLKICRSCADYLHNFELTLRSSKAAFAMDPASPIPEELVQAILAASKKT